RRPTDRDRHARRGARRREPAGALRADGRAAPERDGGARVAAHFIALRYRLLLGTLRRSPCAIVALVVTVLGGLSVLGMEAVGAIALRALAPELGGPAAVLVGAGLVVGLAAISVLIGTSDPLAAERFSLLPVRPRQLRRGLLAAQLLDVWGIVPVLAFATLL